MPLDSDRCHFCGNWTKEYRKIGDRSICKDCMKEFIQVIKEELEKD